MTFEQYIEFVFLFSAVVLAIMLLDFKLSSDIQCGIDSKGTKVKK